MTIQQLIEAMNTRAQQVQALAAIEAKGEELTAEQHKQFKTLQAEHAQLGEKLSRARAAEQLAIEEATPVVSKSGPAIHVKSAPEDYKGSKVARFAMSVAAGKGDLNLAKKFAENEIGDKTVAMAISTAEGSGGALVPENYGQEVIEMLRPRTIVRDLGANVAPLVNGNLTIPRHSGGATSGYKGENEARNAEGGSTDDVKLAAKTQMTIVPMSNELIGYAGFAVEQLFLNDMIAAMANRQDKAFLRDDGTNNTPKGLRKTALDGGRVVPFAGDKADPKAIDAYLDLLILTLMNSDSSMIKCGWGMSPRTFMFLQGIRDGNGNKYYPEMAQGMLKGYKIRHTTNVPVNLGVGSNETEIYFADFNDVIIGETGSLTIDFSREATYNDADGNLVSAYSRNQSVLRVVGGNDVGFRHLEGLVLGSAVNF